MILKYTGPLQWQLYLNTDTNCSFSFVFFVKCSVKNTSNKSEDHEKYPQWKQNDEKFPEGTCL